jgi:hypothetical protein
MLYWIVAISNDVSYLWQMVGTRATEDAALGIPEGSTGHRCGHGQAPHASPLPPPPHAPVSIDELLAAQNELMRMLVQNEAHHGED